METLVHVLVFVLTGGSLVVVGFSLLALWRYLDMPDDHPVDERAALRARELRSKAEDMDEIGQYEFAERARIMARGIEHNLYRENIEIWKILVMLLVGLCWLLLYFAVLPEWMKS